MKSHSIFLIAVSFLALFTGCVNDDLKDQESNENRIINEYLSAHPEFIESVNGIYVNEIQAGSGLAPVKDKYVFVNYTGRYLADLKIRETNDSSLKSQWPSSAYFTQYLFGPSKILYGYSMPGVNNALSDMLEGSQVSVIIRGDQANQDYTPLLYDLELIKVIPDNRIYEDSVIHAFLDKNDFGPETQVDTSMWFKVISSSGISEDSVQTADTVYITYTGWLVDYLYDSLYTRIFDANSIKYLYNTKITSGTMILANGKIPKCITMALDRMKEGDKARILSLYEYAFGNTGLVNSKYNYTVIPKLQTVWYDIEITRLTRNP